MTCDILERKMWTQTHTGTEGRLYVKRHREKVVIYKLKGEMQSLDGTNPVGNWGFQISNPQNCVTKTVYYLNHPVCGILLR